MSPKYKVKLLSFIAMITQYHTQAQGNLLSFDELKDRIIQNSRAIHYSNIAEKIVLQDYKQAVMDQLPTLSVFGAADKATNMPIYENGLNKPPVQHDVVHTLYSSGANFYLNLFNGFKQQQEKKLLKIEQEITELETEKQTALTLLKGIYLFYDIHVQLRWRDIILKDIEEKEHELQDIKNLYTAGVILESDIYRAELELSKRRMTLIEIENNIVVNQQSLNVLMGKADDYEIVPVVHMNALNTNIQSLEDALQIAHTHAYDNHISHQHVLAQTSKLKLNQSNYSPKVGLTGSFQFSNPQIFLYLYNESWYDLGIAGIKVSYDLNSIYHNRHKVQKAKIALAQAVLHHHIVDDDIRTKVYQAYYNWEESQKRMLVYEKNKQYAMENARILKNAYFSHTTLITDLLDANVLLLKAEFELEQAKINTIKSYFTLQYELGQF